MDQLLKLAQSTCIKNMLALAPSLGCAPNDATCLCSNPDFGYGVRDCALESCPSTADANQVIAYGLAYCKSRIALPMCARFNR